LQSKFSDILLYLCGKRDAFGSQTFSPRVSNTCSSIPAAIAATCVVESALQTMKQEQIAPSIFEGRIFAE